RCDYDINNHMNATTASKEINEAIVNFQHFSSRTGGHGDHILDHLVVTGRYHFMGQSHSGNFWGGKNIAGALVACKGLHDIAQYVIYRNTALHGSKRSLCMMTC